MPGYGQYTQVDLSQLGFLSPDRLAAPAPDREAARFALELAAVAYDLAVDRWLDAGWTDISIQADEKLVGGVRAPDSAGRPLRQRLLNEYLAFSARRHIHSRRILRSVRGMMGPREEALDTGKAIAMIHPLPSGRWALAVGFMGTGRRMIDWAANFRLAHPEGFHEGFLHLTRQFSDNAALISFEGAARALGLASLTLRDVLDEARRPDSRFVIFAAGHSQGAAVLQLWIHQLLSEGVLASNLLGYGFAPPSVSALPAGSPDDYPLFHFINSDDIVPRVGLLHHLGRCYVYEADDALRAFCYQGMQTEGLFMQMLRFAEGFRGTEDTLRFLISVMEALQALPRREAAEALAVLIGRGLRERLLLNQDEPVSGLLRLMSRTLRGYYREAAGAPPSDGQLAPLTGLVLTQMRVHGAEHYARACLQVMSVPHRLVFSEPGLPGLAPYSYLVIRGFSRLRPLPAETDAQ